MRNLLQNYQSDNNQYSKGFSGYFVFGFRNYFVIQNYVCIFTLQNANDMTQITTTNAKNIKNALSNPFGFEMSNTPDVRKAVASEVDKMLIEIRAKHAAKNKDSVYAK